LNLSIVYSAESKIGLDFCQQNPISSAQQAEMTVLEMVSIVNGASTGMIFKDY